MGVAGGAGEGVGSASDGGTGAVGTTAADGAAGGDATGPRGTVRTPQATVTAVTVETVTRARPRGWGAVRSLENTAYRTNAGC